MRTLAFWVFVTAVPAVFAARIKKRDFFTVQGFNYGPNDLNGNPRTQAEFEAQFNSAKNLVGASPAFFNSARLLTSLQPGTNNSITSAIPAAISTNTTLLLGIECSSGQDVVHNEIQAILNAYKQYGSAFVTRIKGICVGNEDVYRTTQRAIDNEAGPGATGDEIISYISQLRASVRGTPLEFTPVGHADTWDVWTNSSGWVYPLVQTVDFLGMSAYPYYENETVNTIDNANYTFYDAWVQNVDTVADVWITATGWPVSGPQNGQAIASVANAKTYWDDVGCHAWSTGINIWWDALQDNCCDSNTPSFGIVGAGSPPPTTPKFNITCPVVAAASGGTQTTSTHKGAAIAQRTGAVGAAVLFGGAAMVLNNL